MLSKSKPAVPSTPVRTVCAYECVQLWNRVLHWTVLIILPLILQTIITAQMMS